MFLNLDFCLFPYHVAINYFFNWISRDLSCLKEIISHAIRRGLKHRVCATFDFVLYGVLLSKDKIVEPTVMWTHWRMKALYGMYNY